MAKLAFTAVLCSKRAGRMDVEDLGMRLEIGHKSYQGAPAPLGALIQRAGVPLGLMRGSRLLYGSRSTEWSGVA